LLKPGGRLVYAACSLLAAENEAVALAFSTERSADFKPIAVLDALTAARVPSPESLCNGNFLRLWPHRQGTDGFFAAAWQRL